MGLTSAISSAADGSPALWLAKASFLNRESLQRGNCLPPFVAPLETLSAEDEDKLREAYEHAVLNLGSAEEDLAMDRLRSIIDDIPFVGEPYALLGLAALSNGDAVEAASLGKAASKLIEQWGNAWDKRLPRVSWLAISSVLEQCALLMDPELSFIAERLSSVFALSHGRLEVIYAQLDAVDFFGQAISHKEDSSSHILDDDDDDWRGSDIFEPLPNRFAVYVKNLCGSARTSLSAPYPDIEERQLWDTLEFHIAADLKTHASEIEDECLRFLSVNNAELKYDILPSPWQAIPLFFDGEWLDDVRGQLPSLERVIHNNMSALRARGMVSLACLPADSRTSFYGGLNNLSLRCTLPFGNADRCSVNFDIVSERLRPGTCIIISDSMNRRDVNAGSMPLFALMLDLWHPDLTRYELQLLDGLRHFAISCFQHESSLSISEALI